MPSAWGEGFVVFPEDDSDPIKLRYPGGALAFSALIAGGVAAALLAVVFALLCFDAVQAAIAGWTSGRGNLISVPTRGTLTPSSIAISSSTGAHRCCAW